MNKTAETTTSNNAKDNTISPGSEQDMLYNLKAVIDTNSRYKEHLNTLATGYAAGKGVDTFEARDQIIAKYEKQFGMSPLEYSNRLYDQRRENGRSQGTGRSR